MLIVCTKDPTIVQTAQNPASGSPTWGQLIVINVALNQAMATQSLIHALGQLGPNEALCFSAHGNDNEIGDAGGGVNDWGWTRADIATLLAHHAPMHYVGPILVHACAQNVSNFSAGLAVALQHLQSLNGVWIYGYNRPVAAAAPFPDPARMGQNVELQGTHVHFALQDRPLAAAPAVAGYRITFPSGHVVELPSGFDLEEARNILGLVAEGVLRERADGSSLQAVSPRSK